MRICWLAGVGSGGTPPAGSPAAYNRWPGRSDLGEFRPLTSMASDRAIDHNEAVSVEDDDLAADDTAAAQGLQVLVDVLEPDLGDVVLDLSGVGECQHLDEVVEV